MFCYVWDPPRWERYKNAQLGIATHRANLPQVKEWIRRGANVNCSDATQGTLLHVACRQVLPELSLELVQVLLEHGANVYAEFYGQVPLHIAAEMGHIQVVAQLLLSGADVLARRNDDRATPLHLACRYNRLHVIIVLLFFMTKSQPTVGRGVHAVDVHGETPLFVACFHGHAEGVECFMSFVPQNDINFQYRNKAGWTILHAACRSGLLEVVKAPWMRAAFADVNVTEVQGWTPLHVACFCQKLPVVQYLLEHTTANVDARTKDGFTPLELACCQAEELDVIYYLIREHGLDRFSKTGHRTIIQSS